MKTVHTVVGNLKFLTRGRGQKNMRKGNNINLHAAWVEFAPLKIKIKKLN